jgi:hypothetical protein
MVLTLECHEAWTGLSISTSVIVIARLPAMRLTMEADAPSGPETQ